MHILVTVYALKLAAAVVLISLHICVTPVFSIICPELRALR